MGELFYQDPKRWGYCFQNLVMISRYHLINDAVKSGCKVIITERCLESDYNIFARMSYETWGNMEKVHFEVYERMYHELQLDNINHTYVYLTTGPKVCYERIQIRNRPGEKHINLNYLSELDTYHRKWLVGKKT